MLEKSRIFYLKPVFNHIKKHELFTKYKNNILKNTLHRWSPIQIVRSNGII